MRRFLAVLLVCFTAMPAFPQGQRFGETIEVALVNVDVIVTDRAGNHVRGLTAADFQVFENGKPQPVTNFAEYRGTAAARTVVAGAAPNAPAPAAAEAAPPQKRTIVVFVDKMQVYGRERKQLFDGLKQFVRRTVRPGDSVAIASWLGGARTAQDFTDDVPRLEAALDALADEKVQAQKSEWDNIEFERNQLEWFYNVAASMGVSPGMGVGRSVSQFDANARVILDVRQKARSITSLMQAIAGAEGQKVMVLLSNRFAPSSGSEYVGANNKGAVSALNQIEEMLRVAKTNGIRIYPLYTTVGDFDIGDTAALGKGPHSLRAATQQSTYRNIETSSLMDVALETGGVAGTGLGDLEKVTGSIAEDFESYYSLAYRATAAKEGREKRLVVKVKNGAYHVRTRRDVLDRTSETLLRQRIMASLLKPAHAEGFPVKVVLGTPKYEANLLHLPVELKFTVGALTLLPEGAKRSGGFSVYAAWSGELGTTSEITKASQPIAVQEPEFAAAQAKLIVFELDLVATRAVEHVVVAVVDDVSQEVGLVRLDLPRQKAP
jgi:VWFA-related protein